MKGVKLEKIQKDLEGFDYDIQMYMYHKLNGRDDEANTYLNAYVNDINDKMLELKPVDNEFMKSTPEPTPEMNLTIDLKPIENITIIDDDIPKTRKYNLYDVFE